MEEGLLFGMLSEGTHTYTNARKDETTQRDRLEGEEEEEKGKDEKSLRCADSEMQNSKIKGRR